MALFLAPMTEAHPYLGVAQVAVRPASGWSGRATSDSALAISQRCQVPEIVGRMLAARGQSLEGAPGFLQPRLRDLLPDPSQLPDMDQAAERAGRRGRARRDASPIFGDYDVDGATSAALLSRFLRAAGAPEPLLYVPDRMREGYGPNAAGASTR